MAEVQALMMNAAQVAATRDAEKGILSNKELG